MKIRTSILLWITLALIIISVSPTISDINFRYWHNARDLEPIVIKGEYFIDFLRKPIQELYLFAYDSTNHSWRPVPFQFDQMDDSTHYWLPVPNDTLDENDELVFMAKDMGHRAIDGSIWIDDLDSRNYNRVEISAMDSLSGKAGWIYLYRSKNMLPLATETYVGYKAGKTDALADTVFGQSYIEGHNNKCIPDYWVCTPAGRVDILDRQKMAIDLIAYFYGIPIPLTIREDALEDPKATTIQLKIKTGPVRIIRQVFWHVNIGYGYPPFDFSVPLLYYANSVESGGVSGTLKESNHVNKIRQSFDLNPSATGMKLYNPYNQAGITIDGIGGSEGVVTTVLDAPGINWWMVTGNQGTYAVVLKLSPLGEKRSLYYLDDKKPLGEGEDTGDFMSWGDTGIKIEGKDIAGRISIAYKAFYFGPNQPYALGDTLGNNFSKPMVISTQPNYYVPVELASFQATVDNGQVILEWVTATESNNYGFEIHRRSAASLEWSTIGFVQGKGTTITSQYYRFVDDQISAGSYYYRLKQIDFDGRFDFSPEIFIDLALPQHFALEQNYPNPFNPETIIRYQIPPLSDGSIQVDLKIYNLLGAEVRSLVHQEQRAGYYLVHWDGKNDHGANLAAGTYIYRLQAGQFTQTHKMLLLR
ncbi:MAG: T9SS type A sorting domain-containing protein [candidate division KSB1 bacterium]|nr:T9SS type A sorting domain-containing protein [candidate division KSB1 bacterium]